MAQLRAVGQRPSEALRGNLAALRRKPAAERARAVGELCGPTSWEGALGRAITDAPTEFERVDAASEAVGDLGAFLASRSRWAQTAVRLQAAVGLLLGALAFAQGERLWAGAALGAGILLALFTHFLAESAASRERAQRELADELIRLLLPDATEPRWGRRRGRD